MKIIFIGLVVILLISAIILAGLYLMFQYPIVMGILVGGPLILMLAWNIGKALGVDE